jgi:hypothetical protein
MKISFTCSCSYSGHCRKCRDGPCGYPTEMQMFFIIVKDGHQDHPYINKPKSHFIYQHFPPIESFDSKLEKKAIRN